MAGKFEMHNQKTLHIQARKSSLIRSSQYKNISLQLYHPILPPFSHSATQANIPVVDTNEVSLQLLLLDMCPLTIEYYHGYGADLFQNIYPLQVPFLVMTGALMPLSPTIQYPQYLLLLANKPLTSDRMD